MSQTLRVDAQEQEQKDIWLACGSCGRDTCHRVLKTVKTSDESPDGDIQVWDDYLIVLCQGCRTVSFCITSQNSEDIEVDQRTGQQYHATTFTLYPSRIAGRPEMQSLGEVPYGISRIYRETHQALCNNQSILAGIGIRAIVEAVCKERDAIGKDLQKKIDDLATKKVITDDAATILHNIRFMGNEAAHEVTAHTVEELTTAFSVIEYLLQGVYVMPKQAAKLPKRTVQP
jgi:hypothetical protein